MGFIVFVFFKQKTAYEMRISDWSSDVCSSDLQIYDLARLRELVDVGRTMVEGALDTSESVDPQAQIEEAETALYRVAGGEAEMGSVKSFSAASLTALQAAERALNSGGHLSGITTGIASINAKIGGMHNSDLMILAGRPGMGKTSLATNIAYNAAERFRRDEDDGIPPEKNIDRKSTRLNSSH